MSDAPDAQGVDVAVGPYHLAAKGNLTVIVVCVLGVVATILFTGWRIESAAIHSHDSLLLALSQAKQAEMEEHKYLIRSQDMMSCILTLSVEERRALRERYFPGALQVNCPWIDIPGK